MPKIADWPRHENAIYDLVVSGVFSIDELGRVWRNLRDGNRRRAEHRKYAGYLQVRAMRGCVRRYAAAHRLVWRVYRGEIPPGMTVNHINGIKDDNRLENLELCTPSEQLIHAHRTGLKIQDGEKNPCAKLSDSDVAKIRAAYASGSYTMMQLGEKFGVTFQHISVVVRGKSRSRQRGVIQPRDLRHSVCGHDPITGRFVSNREGI